MAARDSEAQSFGLRTSPSPPPCSRVRHRVRRRYRVRFRYRVRVDVSFVRRYRRCPLLGYSVTRYRPTGFQPFSPTFGHRPLLGRSLPTSYHVLLTSYFLLLTYFLTTYFTGHTNPHRRRRSRAYVDDDALMSGCHANRSERRRRLQAGPVKWTNTSCYR